MNAPARAWVEALRSGRFTQTKDTLRDRRGFCCLGVACELYREATREGVWLSDMNDTGDLGFEASNGEVALSFLPPIVQRWLGLKSPTGQFFDPGDGRADTLADMNDGGTSFAGIADVIEAEETNLFLGEVNS